MAWNAGRRRHGFDDGESHPPGATAEDLNMAEIINLNRARKDRARIDKKVRAAGNRVAHGRTKGEKLAEKKERDRAARLLDGQKLDD